MTVTPIFISLFPRPAILSIDTNSTNYFVLLAAAPHQPAGAEFKQPARGSVRGDEGAQGTVPARDGKAILRCLCAHVCGKLTGAGGDVSLVPMRAAAVGGVWTTVIANCRV